MELSPEHVASYGIALSVYAKTEITIDTIYNLLQLGQPMVSHSLFFDNGT